jgi:hypothetical protein
LFANGQTFLVDPGIYSTQLGADWRNFFRGSRAHNTVIVDGQDQSILVDTWRVDRPARATLHQWLTTAKFDFVDGSHDGYQRLSEGITHRRQIFFVKPEYWIVVDLLTGSGIHEFDLLFHLAADFQTHFDADTAQLHICGARETKLVVAPLHQTGLEATLISGEVNPIQGWVSRYSGEKFPAPVLCYRQRTSAPAQFCTILYPIAQGQSSKLDVSPLAVDVDQGPMLDEVTAVQIRFDDRVDYLVIDRSVARRRKRFGGYETDAQLVYLQHQPDNQRSDRNIRHGGTYLSFQGCAIEAEPADVRSAVEQSSR